MSFDFFHAWILLNTSRPLFEGVGGCVSNLDFVESIFGNAGDPTLPENDAGLDTLHWTGTTGCVILAPRKYIDTHHMLIHHIFVSLHYDHSN